MIILFFLYFFKIFALSFEIKYLNYDHKFRALLYGDKKLRKLILYFPKERKRKVYFNPYKYLKIDKGILNTYTLIYKNKKLILKPQKYKVHTLLKALQFHPNMISVTIYQPIFYWKHKKKYMKSLILEYNFPSLIWFERRTYAGKFGKYKVYRSYFYKWDFLVYYYLDKDEPLSIYLIKDIKRNREYLIDIENNICWNLKYAYPVKCKIELY